MSDRTFYPVQADRSVTVGALLGRAAEAGIPANFTAGSVFSALVDADAMPRRVELTIFNPGGSLNQIAGDVLGGLRREDLRPANLHEAVEFALAHRDALLSALPLNVIGSVIRLPNFGPGTTRFAQGFIGDGKGGAVLRLDEHSSFCGPVNFLAAKL